MNVADVLNALGKVLIGSFRLKRGAEASLPTLRDGEPAWTTDTFKLFVGSSAGNQQVAGGGGSGTVSTISVVTANGVSGNVANPATTPAITLTLGAITPTSVAASGAVTGSNLSGANTGDQTNISGNAATVTTNANLTGPITSVGNATTIAAGAVTLAMQANMATASVVYRKTAGSGAPEVQTLATLKTDLGLTGTNSGDQTTIVGITGTIAQFNTACVDADFASTTANILDLAVVRGAGGASGVQDSNVLIDTTGNIYPKTDGGAALGKSSNQWNQLRLNSGATIQFAGADVIFLHSAGIVTVSAGELRIATPGTNAASVPTLGATQTFTATKVNGIAANAQVGTTYTLALTDDGKLVTLSNASAITLTVPLNASVAFPVGAQIDLIQLGVGQVTVSPAGGVTINSYTSLVNIAGKYAGATLRKIATDTWVLVGNLA